MMPVTTPIDVNPFTLPAVLLSERKHFPKVACVYFAISDGRIWYIGRSINFRQRWALHHRVAELEKIGSVKIAYLSVDSPKLLAQIEEALIKRFEPTLNKRKTTRPQLECQELAQSKLTQVHRTLRKNVFGLGKASWLLREVMARRKITNKALAERLGKHPATISRLKGQDTLPEIGGDAIEEIRAAISELSQDKFGVCKMSEILRIEESNIAELRRAAGLTQNELADCVGVTESTIRNWENNRNGVEWFVRIAKLCEALNCSPRGLVRFVEAENEAEANLGSQS